MSITYTNYVDIAAESRQRSTQLNELSSLTNTIRSNIQWAGFYEKDLLLERALGKSIASASSLEKQGVNLYRLQVLLSKASGAVDGLNKFLRNKPEHEITADLKEMIQERRQRLEQYENSNDSQQQQTLATLLTGSNLILQEVAAGKPGWSKEANSLLAELLPLSERLESHHEALKDLSPSLFAVELKLQDLERLNLAYKVQDEQQNHLATQYNLKSFYLAIAIVLVAFVINAMIFNFGILHPIESIMTTIKRVRAGDDLARSNLEGNDELGQLSTVLDELLDEKNRTFTEQETQRNTLNGSVISLIQNVFQLSQRDLTIRVPVAEDVTGAVSDSINQLAESIETTLKEVINVSQRVNITSSQILSQSDNVRSHSSKEQEEISETLEGLESLIKAMHLIAKLATVSHTNSKNAIQSSENAMTSVSETINSINKIRQTIHEAEKRIKRLGERSQEIGGIVGLINNISERTHILSLNASMHAASAGEAGRGLMVVVDEVQRLAENSREATAEIETLVNNIQLETSETIQAMNTVITDVVAGTRLAEEAGERMSETRATTNTLVESVVRIARSAISQSKAATQLRERATSIDESTNITNSKMLLQSELSEQLVQAAEELQQSVSVFKLTAA
ncbi:MAG: methyl-accepting chemotaxis protein [Motiliproteus sp.]